LDTTTPLSRLTTRIPLIAIGGLVTTAIIAVAGVRLSGLNIHEPDAPILMERSLQFTDRPDGGIDVIDARSARVIDTVVGQAGFVRGTLRGLARERRRAGIGSKEPFELIAHTDGRLTLLDPSTSRRVDLESFGPTNMGDFLRLLNRDNQVANQDDKTPAPTPAPRN
jgi:putative photosynthetic complex assembly protein